MRISLKQLLQGGLNGLLAGVTDPFVPNEALVVDDVERRRRWRIPSFGNRAIIGETAPIELLGIHHFLKRLWRVRQDVDAQHREGFAGKILDERPLVGPMCPSRQSVFLPKVQENDFAAVVC